MKASETGEDEEYPGKEVDELYRHFRNWIVQASRKTGLHDWLMVVFTGVLTIVAIQQYLASSNSSRTSSEQITKIINAADRIEDAADSFSGSAAHINEGVGEAVATLQNQASELDQSRRSSELQSAKSLKTAIQSGRSDLRPYIVTPVEKPDGYTVYCDAMYGGICAKFEYRNAGRTPAVAIIIDSFLIPDVRIDRARYPMKVERYTGLEGSVLGNTDPGFGVTRQASRPVPPCSASSYHQRPCGDIVYGLIRYKDIFGEPHETGFCTFFPDTNQTPPRSCVTGNWFDKRPDGYVEEQ